MARTRIADPTRDLTPYLEQPTAARRKPAAHLEYVTDAGTPVPVRKPSSHIQITPIVQPVSFVPYSTQKQPLLTEDYEDDVVAYDNPEEPEEAIAENYAYGNREEPKKNLPTEAPKSRGLNGASFALVILSLVSVAVLILGKFISGLVVSGIQIGTYTAYINIANGLNGYEIVEGFIKGFLGGFSFDMLSLDMIFPAALALSALFILLTFIGSLVRIVGKGACNAAKAGTVLTLLFAVVALVFAIVKNINLSGCYGLYAYVGLSLVMMLIALLSKKAKAPYKK